MSQGAGRVGSHPEDRARTEEITRIHVVEDVLADIEETLVRETDYTVEARTLERMRTLLSELDHVVVPRHYPEFSTERVLGAMHLLGGLAMLGAATVMQGDTPSPLVINLLLFGHMLCYFPTLSLTNSLALHNMTNAEKQFPLIRVFGRGKRKISIEVLQRFQSYIIRQLPDRQHALELASTDRC